MSKKTDYRKALKKQNDWTPFMLKNSGLPGPRGNLELAQVVAEEGNIKLFEKFLSYQAEENTPEVFVVFCGVVGLGRLATHQTDLFERIRTYASDPRWRIREAVATGLQMAGDQDIHIVLKEMQNWSEGNWYEKRATAATLAEPRLLKEPAVIEEVLHILDRITASMEDHQDQKDEAYKVLRQGMGYCWSVVIAALPEAGKPVFEKWLATQNKDVQWMLKQNLNKNRLTRMDATWVDACKSRLEGTISWQ